MSLIDTINLLFTLLSVVFSELYSILNSFLPFNIIFILLLSIVSILGFFSVLR